MRQRFSTTRIENVRETVREQLLAAGLQKQIQPGWRIAITAGSRGIGGFVELLSGIADAIKAVGGKPIVIPAMGSHGSATESGQREILNRLGVTEDTIQVPVMATMETVSLGRSDSGAEAHLDAIAAQADGIIVLGRVITHPESAEGLASGLLKMTTVGLGKQVGAQEAHSHGLWKSVRAVPKLTLAQRKILFGVAMVENAYRQPMIIETVRGTYEAFLEADERLLKRAQVPKLPFEALDVLAVDEIGKTISGSGMDTNVIGDWRLKGGKREPDFFRIVALSLTKASLGNGLGIGFADFTTDRFMRSYDPAPTWINLLTATEPGAVNTREATLPLALPSDREAIEVALHSALAPQEPRFCRIRNTADLSEFYVSKALLDEVSQHRQLEVVSELQPFSFDPHGNLF